MDRTQFPEDASVLELYKWLAENEGFQNQQSYAPSAVSASNGVANGKNAGTMSAAAANGVAVSSGRSRAQRLAKDRPMVEHESYMATAVELAVGRPAHPFAALLVDGSTGDVIADGVNSTKSNPLFHGEIVCINNAAKSFTRFDWRNTVLYTTAEPCCMCQAAILWSRIPHVVFGTSIETLRLLGWDQFSMDAADVINAAPFANCKVDGGVLVDRCDALFQVAAEIRRS